MSAYAGGGGRRAASGGRSAGRPRWWYATAVTSGASGELAPTGRAGRAPDVALAINPTAGGGRGAAVGARVAASLRADGLTVAEVVGADAIDADRRMRAAVERGCGALIACGGDGMVHHALQVVAGTEVPLGVVPAGSGNDFARALDQPLTGFGWLGGAVVAGRTRSIDLGRAGDRWFGTVLAAGFDSRVNDRMNRMRFPRGRVRYHSAIVRELATFHALRFALTVDGEPREIEAMLVAIGNGRSYGGGMRICPDAAVDDGLFDVTVVRRISRATLVRLFPSVYSGRHVLQPMVDTFRCRRITVASPDVRAYADGEPVAPLPVSCTVVPGAARVLVPGPTTAD